MTNEASIVVNGVTLTEGQAITVRLALSSADFDCGGDAHGLEMSRNYRSRAHEVLTLIHSDRNRGRQPQSVACSKCRHTWVGFYLPMPMSDAARVMKSLTCPMCAAGSKEIVVFERRLEMSAEVTE